MNTTYTPKIIQLTFLLYEDGRVSALADGGSSSEEWNRQFFSLLSKVLSDDGSIKVSFSQGKPSIPIKDAEGMVLNDYCCV